MIVGDTAVVRVRVTVDGVLTIPSSITVKVRTPSGVETTYPVGANLVNDSDGIYRALIDCTESGRWDGVFLLAGPTAKGSSSFNFDVADHV